jgi:hypothetical protein
MREKELVYTELSPFAERNGWSGASNYFAELRNEGARSFVV